MEKKKSGQGLHDSPACNQDKISYNPSWFIDMRQDCDKLPLLWTGKNNSALIISSLILLSIFPYELSCSLCLLGTTLNLMDTK